MKILEICAKLNIGGAQKVAANISEYARQDMTFTYIVYGKQVGEYESSIVGRGNKVIHLDEPRSNPVRHMLDLLSVMKKERPDVVHCHTMFSCGIVMLIAKLCGVPGRISHSHTIQEGVDAKPRRVYQTLMQELIIHCGTDFWACGDAAGNILYGEQWFKQHGLVISNGVDTATYAYSESNRNKIRHDLDLEGRFVIGHVGHYTPEKNQSYLIQLLPDILAKRENTVLLLYGEGECRAALENQIHQLHLEEHARLMGNSDQIPQILSAFDVFAFPSIFEGTPLALIEAQANGLPCIISEGIPQDACLMSSVYRLPLENGEEKWIEKICAASRNPDAREELSQSYEDVSKSMEKMYSVFQKYAH